MIHQGERDPVTQERRERRRFARVPVRLPGRYMLSDRSDHPCTGTAFSPGNLQLEGPVIGAVGERAVCHFEHLGRLEGEIVRPTAGGFVMSIQASRQRRLKLADQLTWLANREVLGLGDCAGREPRPALATRSANPARGREPPEGPGHRPVSHRCRHRRDRAAGHRYPPRRRQHAGDRGASRCRGDRCALRDADRTRAFQRGYHPVRLAALTRAADR